MNTDLQSNLDAGEAAMSILAAEEEIPSLYGLFADVSVDSSIRSDNNRTTEVREWLIACRK